MNRRKLVLIGAVLVMCTGCSYHAAQDTIVDATKKIGGSIKSAAVKTGDYFGSGFKTTGNILADGFKMTAQAVTSPFTKDKSEDDEQPYRLKSDEAYEELVEDVSVNEIVDLSPIKRPADGHVVRGELLSPFGVVLLVPFRPGVEVADNDLSDDVAIRITRGLRDVLINQNEYGRYDVVFSEDSQKADFVINGYITKIQDSSLLDTLMLAADKITIGVRGQMRDKDSDDVILTFKDEVTFRRDQIGHKGLADVIGQNVASFILEQVNREREL